MKLDDFPVALSFGDVLLEPQYSEIDSRSEVDLSTSLTEKIKLKIPLISINMDSVTGVDMAIAMGRAGGLGFLPRFEPPESQAKKVGKVKEAGVIAAAAVGCKEDSMKRAQMLVDAGTDILTLDVAHGHLKKAVDMTKKLSEKFGDKVEIFAGVVGTYEATKALFEAGADCVRVGVGPGTICTTRIKTGHGVPQITALLEASKAAREFKKTIISDGGTENSGDIVKALAAGASAVVSGYQLAGCEETPSKIVEIDGKKYKEYNASTSKKEKIRQLTNFNNGKSSTYVNHVEGIESYVAYTGKTSEVVEQIMAGVRSGFSYSGARDLNKLWEKAKFMRITPAGTQESESHAVIPNGN